MSQRRKASRGADPKASLVRKIKLSRLASYKSTPDTTKSFRKTRDIATWHCMAQIHTGIKANPLTNEKGFGTLNSLLFH
ncbi:hypothetical protein C4D60_Mb04t15180 [Musa balbisiana]|uniref:Uncharacterized protein n=1 Tax=Musa balbisiana TaxID=52838 RepID=A0A4S8KC58_MUSBA|nr:hypothetical protein C4D60_Mb04t15180 [Musa balbisiana]